MIIKISFPIKSFDDSIDYHSYYFDCNKTSPSKEAIKKFFEHKIQEYKKLYPDAYKAIRSSGNQRVEEQILSYLDKFKWRILTEKMSYLSSFFSK